MGKYLKYNRADGPLHSVWNNLCGWRVSNARVRFWRPFWSMWQPRHITRYDKSWQIMTGQPLLKSSTWAIGIFPHTNCSWEGCWEVQYCTRGTEHPSTPVTLFISRWWWRSRHISRWWFYCTTRANTPWLVGFYSLSQPSTTQYWWCYNARYPSGCLSVSLHDWLTITKSGLGEWPPNFRLQHTMPSNYMGWTESGMEKIGLSVSLGVVWPTIPVYKTLLHGAHQGGSPYVILPPLI